MTYLVEVTGLSELESRLNSLTTDGWNLIQFVTHPFDTKNGEVEFITIWSK